MFHKQSSLEGVLCFGCEAQRFFNINLMDNKENFIDGKPFTWADLKEFVNAIPDEHLQRKAVIVNPDVEPVWLTGYFREDLYVNKHDSEDAYFAADFDDAVEADLVDDREDYEFDNSRPPFLTTDLGEND